MGGVSAVQWSLCACEEAEVSPSPPLLDSLLPSNGGDGPLRLTITREGERVWGRMKGCTALVCGLPKEGT